MTTQLTDVVLKYTAKLLAVASGMAMFILISIIYLWRGGPDVKFLAGLNSGFAIALYLATVTTLLRLRKKVKDEHLALNKNKGL